MSSNSRLFYPQELCMSRDKVIAMIEDRIFDKQVLGEIDYTVVGQPDYFKLNDGMMQSLVDNWYSRYIDDVMDGLDPEGSAAFRQEQALYWVALAIQQSKS